MLLQTNSYIVPKEKRAEHARLMRRFRQILNRVGCDNFEVYEQVGANWSNGQTSDRFVQIMRFRDRRHQLAVQNAERSDPAAQELIAEFCELINYQYQVERGWFAVGFYTSVLPVAPTRVHAATGDQPGGEQPNAGHAPEAPEPGPGDAAMAAAAAVAGAGVAVALDNPAEAQAGEGVGADPSPADETFATGETTAQAPAPETDPDVIDAVTEAPVTPVDFGSTEPAGHHWGEAPAKTESPDAALLGDEGFLPPPAATTPVAEDDLLDFLDSDPSNSAENADDDDLLGRIAEELGEPAEELPRHNKGSGSQNGAH